MNKGTNRVCIYPKDIMRVTGKTERTSRNLLARMRKHFSKSEYQFITVTEFSTYTGIDQQTIEQCLVD